MKGWQNQIIYAQKINCAKDLVTKIIAFEAFEYLQGWQDGIIKYEVPFQQCFNLQHLIDSLKLNFIKIYKGQALIITNEILQHLKQLHSNNLNNLSHGQLEPKNIFISLKNNKNNKLTIYQVPIHIKKINFINYKGIDNENYQVNQIADIQQIIKSIQQFIQVIEDYQQCQLLQLINNQLQQIDGNINQNSLQELCLFFNQLITRHVDLQTQQIQQGLYRESPNYESFISLRHRSETMIINYLERLSMWDFYVQIEIQPNNLNNEQNLPVIFENQRFLNHGQNNDEQQITLILLNTIKNTVMLQFWAEFGEKLNTWTFSFNSVIKDFQDKTNNNLLQLPHWFQKINDILIQCQQKIPKQIIDQILEQFKFELEINQDIKNKIAQLYLQQLLIKFQNFDLFADDQDQVYDQIQESIKKEVLNYYNEQKQTKILELIADLI